METKAVTIASIPAFHLYNLKRLTIYIKWKNFMVSTTNNNQFRQTVYTTKQNNHSIKQANSCSSSKLEMVRNEK